MNSARLRTVLITTGIYLMGVVICFVLGSQSLHSAPILPNCTTCDCKVVTFWRDGLRADKGVYVTDTATLTDHATLNIWQTGTCGIYPDQPNGDCDKWTVVNASLTCTSPPLSVAPWELKDSAPGQSIGTMERISRRKCS